MEDWHTALPWLAASSTPPTTQPSLDLLGPLLLTASARGSTSLIGYLLTSHPHLPINYTSPFPSTHAAQKAALAACKALYGPPAKEALKTWFAAPPVMEEDPEGRTGLIFAAGAGHLEAVKTLVERGADVGVRDYFGRTALSWAGGEGRVEAVRFLLGGERVDVNAADNVGRTALTWTLLHRREEGEWDAQRPGDETVHVPGKADGCCAREAIVRALVDQGADIELADVGYRTPLMRAAAQGLLCAVSFLLTRGADPQARDGEDKTALFYAARRGREGVVQLLLDHQAEGSADPRDWSDRTPLSHAAGSGHGGVVRMLLARDGVDPDSRDAWGRSPLSFAAENGHGGIVEMLGARGADPESVDTEDRSPLVWAAKGSGEAAVNGLLAREGVDPDRKDAVGNTPLMWAARKGCAGIVRLLLRRGVDVDYATPAGDSPLRLAAVNGSEDVIAALLQPPAQPCIAHVQAALEAAITSGAFVPAQYVRGARRYEVVRLLLGYPGVDLGWRDEKGRTLVMLAVMGWGERVDLVELLVEAGVGVGGVDGKGRTAVELAEKNGRANLVRILRERTGL